MKYRVCKYGAPALGRKTVDVQKIDDAIRRLAKDMLGVMYETNGVGLATTQIGRSENLCVIDTSQGKRGDSGDLPPGEHTDKMPLVLVNPRIISQKGSDTAQEGCLSVPEVWVDIKRAAEVTVTFKDLENREVTLETTGLLARAVQHELDHLAGRLIVSRMSMVQKIGVAGKLKRLKKEAEDAES